MDFTYRGEPSESYFRSLMAIFPRNPDPLVTANDFTLTMSTESMIAVDAFRILEVISRVPCRALAAP